MIKYILPLLFLTSNCFAISKDENPFTLKINQETFLTDKIILNLFSKETGKKYTNINSFWDNVYSNLTNSERIELITKIKR
jgi:hypothetical protein